MPIESVPRRWTVATWAAPSPDEQLDAVAGALTAVHGDVVALQGVRERDTDELAAALAWNRAWERSHRRQGSLAWGAAIGLAVLTPHRITASTSREVGAARHRWSSRRRISQTATVERADHSGYAICHADTPCREFAFSGPAPVVRIDPELVEVDPGRVFELPDGAVAGPTIASTPVPHGPPLVVTTFELAWVRGDIPLR